MIFWNNVLDIILTGQQILCCTVFVQLFAWVDCSSGLQSCRVPGGYVLGAMHRHHHHLMVVHRMWCLGLGVSYPTGMG